MEVKRQNLHIQQLSEQLSQLKSSHSIEENRPPEYLNAKEVENFVGFSDSSLNRYQKAGKINVAKTGKNKTRYYDKDAIVKFKIWYWNLPSDLR